MKFRLAPKSKLEYPLDITTASALQVGVLGEKVSMNPGESKAATIHFSSSITLPCLSGFPQRFRGIHFRRSSRGEIAGEQGDEEQHQRRESKGHRVKRPDFV